MTRTLGRCVGWWCTLATAAAQSGWQRMQPATVPPARSDAQVAYDLQRGVTIMFGGNAGVVAFRGDTWEWNGADWTARPTAQAPPARYGGAFAYDVYRGRAVLFGGLRAGSPLDASDTWEYDGSNWTQMATTGPSARRFPAMAFDLVTGRMILFGGALGLPATVFSDTWAWNGITWQQLTPAHSPPARWLHSMVTDLRARVVLQGGSTSFSTTATIADTWLWDGTDWSNVPTATNPGLVDSFGMAFDSARGVPVMFGGAPARNGTWLFAGDTWLLHAAPTLPAPRSACNIAYDVMRAKTVLFGGLNGFGVALSDTWVYSAPVIGSWTAVGSGCAGSAGVPSLRPIANARPVVGTMFPLEVTNVVDGSVAIATGLSNVVWQGVSLPVVMDAVGMPGCTVYTSIDFFDFVTAVGGRATFTLTVPASPALAGLQFANQAVSFDPGANALGAVLTNSGFGIVGGI